MPLVDLADRQFTSADRRLLLAGHEQLVRDAKRLYRPDLRETTNRLSIRAPSIQKLVYCFCGVVDGFVIERLGVGLVWLTIGVAKVAQERPSH